MRPLPYDATRRPEPAARAVENHTHTQSTARTGQKRTASDDDTAPLASSPTIGAIRTLGKDFRFDDDADLATCVRVVPMVGAELARFVCTNPTIRRARDVFVRCYDRLTTDTAIPPRDVREIEPALVALEQFLDDTEIYVRVEERWRNRASS